MKPRLPGLLAAIGLAAGLATTNARALLWDFESLGFGSTTSASQTNGGVTMTLTRPGSSFDIDNLSGIGGVPASWLTHTLSPFEAGVGAAAFVANFSSLIANISIAYGDGSPSDIDTMTIQAFSGLNGTGALLGSITSGPCCSTAGTPFEAHVLALMVSGIQSIVFIGGSSDFPNSLYYDNFRADLATVTVPEPASLALLGIGMTGFAWARRRKT